MFFIASRTLSSCPASHMVHPNCHPSSGMQSFPTVQSLADASHDEVNSHWAGLGFYRRARLLHQGAKRVVTDYNGIVPNTVEELMKVEGIGRYTASAIASIAYGVDVPVVDGNVCRVLSRLTGVANHIKAGVLKDDLGWVLAEQIVNAKSCGDGESGEEEDDVIGSPGEFDLDDLYETKVNQALMELGATYCSPSGSGIEEGDPLKDFYVSTQLGVAIGQAIKHDRLASTQPVVGTRNGKNQCRLCDPDGVSSVFYDIVDRINASSKTTTSNPHMISATSGHAAVPMPPPKKAKREEVLAVGVICLEHTHKNDNCWLMVKRPSDGLLAGQWEFPSVCVWTSAQKDPKAKSTSVKLSGDVQVPCIDPSVRSSELNSFIWDVLRSADGAATVKKELSSASRKRVQINDPIVHIFSHVCHTMWVEYGKANSSKVDYEKRWKLKDGREAGWFTARDMQSVGITSGVRKVLTLVEANCGA
ncbi:hypothetical protein HJC23_000697 [Cyclotella cryptica]|uniref:Adenine DNA glycosylase n=1 Tax=Cyclotella cryptica TaxID=29204 RepID=A0ABD3Q999_9STRA